ncbi:hypothetical protein JCM21900_006752 [Sporobolomyces salmonicolor]
MTTQRKPFNLAARKRTATLPAALRTELEELGHIAPQQSRGRLGRKDQRKAKRDQAKQNKAQHQQKGKKRPSEDQQPQPSTSKPSQDVGEPSKKRVKLSTDSDAVAAPAPATAPKKKQTPLEKLLAKQERGSAPDPERKKSKLETDEDREIAWLEAKLGLQGGLSAKDKQKWKEEFAEDGLDELFGGLDDLEGAAFGSSKKNYAKLLRASGDLSDLDLSEGDDDDASDAGASVPEFDGLEGAMSDYYSDEKDMSDLEAWGEHGVSDEELVDPSDDDDHSEMGELGSEHTPKEEEEGVFSPSDLEHDDDEEEEEEGAMTMTFDDEPTSAPSATVDAASAPTAGRYVPPHLRKAAAAAAGSAAPSPAAESTPTASSSAHDAPPDDPRLRRQLQGHLNKLSSTNMSAILDALLALYSSHPRAVVSSSLTGLLLGIISDRDNLGDQLVITYAALVAALYRTVGIEFPAGVLAKAVEQFDAALAKHREARKQGTEEEDEGFEGRPGSKECLNIVAFLAELYNFGVVSCGLVYDLVRLFIESGLGELEVELLSKVIKRSGQQLRQDDPSALKDIITLVKQKMAGVDPSSMNSRTRFMIEQLTNLKNNKFPKADASGAVDNYTPLKKYLSGLNKKRASGAAPDPLRLSLSEIRTSSSRGKWWLVGAAWSGDPLLEAQQSGALGGVATKESQSDAKLAKLARAQGMNTEVRKGVFTVLMSSEDYVDACERLLQLGLSDVQQREIARVLLQCSGNEKAYNPYYTLVAHRLCTKSHSFQITLQYLLWDFLRDLGEKSVGGEELVKNMQDDASSASTSVPERKVRNLARLYGWCLGKEALSVAILKPVPFATSRPQTLAFLSQLVTALLLATQTPSPLFVLPTASARRDREPIERVFVKAAAHGALQKGLGYFLEANGEDVVKEAGMKWGERERAVVKFGIKVASATLGIGEIDVRL